MSVHISQCTFPKPPKDPAEPNSAKEQAASALMWWQAFVTSGPRFIFSAQEPKLGVITRVFTLPVWVDNHELAAVFIESKFAA